MNDRMPASRPLFVLIAILLMTVHAFFMNGHQHIYQYLTVGNNVTPILAKTDPTLFKNSLYVQAVNHSNVRLTLFYDLFPFIVRHFDLEDFTIIVEIISLGFILAGLFRITRILGGSTFAGFVAMLLYTAETNNWILGKPASYVNFFHHGLPYAYPLIIWSMVFFFQQRYTVAFLLAGISWSFHPMCTVFLLAAYGMYWLFNWKAFKPRTLLFCFLAFIIPAIPILMKALNNIGTSQLPDADLDESSYLDRMVFVFSFRLAAFLAVSGQPFLPVISPEPSVLTGWPPENRNKNFYINNCAHVPYRNSICRFLSHTLYNQIKPVAQHRYFSLSGAALHCLRA